jgi:hypothetical protein
MFSAAAPHRKNHHATTLDETTFLPAVSDRKTGENSDPAAGALSQALS